MAIETIAIVHHVHTDLGYTDHPVRAMREHVAYIDQAVDYVLRSSDLPEGAQFAWTQEQLFPVRMWWQSASEAARERFFAALRTGRLEITGTPFNVTAFMSREEWETAMHWIDDELWEQCGITAAMQIDVNGMHTAGMECAYDRGIRKLWIGPNSYYGVPPMPTPCAFNWRIAPEKTMFVWLNSSYNNGTFIFNQNWRQGPVPNYSDLRYRPPEAGDIWDSSDEGLLAAHALCLENVALLEGTVRPDATTETDGFTKNRVFGGYALKTLPVSVTSQWRVDNDPPFYPIVEFVRRWNEKGLRPALKLCTVSQAMEAVHREMGENIPVYEGQWIDWWANGNASSPVEMSCSRQAHRVLKTAKSELFGPMTAQQSRDARAVMEDICMYHEHTFGSWQSVSNPHSFASISQAAEKAGHAYRALDGAECLLAERARSVTTDIRNEIVAFNPGALPLITRITLPRNCLRGTYQSILCRETGLQMPFAYTDAAANFLRPKDPSEFGPENVSRTFSDRAENQGVVFGPVEIPAMGALHLVPQTASAETREPDTVPVTVETDERGWPSLVQFEGQALPVLEGSFGELVSVEADGFSPRWTFKDIFENDDPAEREQVRREHVHDVEASYGAAVRIEENGTLRYEQEITHHALNYGRRILTIEPVNDRLHLEVRIDRRSDYAPSVLFLRFASPRSHGLPLISNAGTAFRPGADQLPGSCMDFYAIDGWVHYPSGWLLNCVDNALVTFGRTGVVARRTETGPEHLVYARIFDNVWDTNFTANACGLMRFRFQAAAGIPAEQAALTAECMETEPVVVVKMGYRSN